MELRYPRYIQIFIVFFVWCTYPLAIPKQRGGVE